MGLKAGRSGLPSPAIQAPTHVSFVIPISFLERPLSAYVGLIPRFSSLVWGRGADEGTPLPHTPPKKQIGLLNHFAI